MRRLEPDAAVELPAHRVHLMEGWSLWRDFLVRGAGFPARRVLALASPELGAAMEALCERQVQLEQAFSQAKEACHRLRVDGDAKTVRQGMQVIKAVNLGKIPRAPLPAVAGAKACAAVEELRRAAAACDEARSRAEALYEAEGHRVSNVLRGEAAEERLREAITWQNRELVHSCLDVLLRHAPEPSSASLRKKERAVANYLQRYCTKNDTIGFFGPLAWGRMVDEGTPLAVTPGPRLLARRHLAFEHWAIAALAETLAALPGMRPHLAPRLLPWVRVQGQLLVTALGDEELAPLPARVLSACDAERPARELAASVRADPAFSSVTEEEIYALLADFSDKQVVRWSLDVPKGADRFDQYLRGFIERLPEVPVRAQALGLFSELMSAKEAVARAAGEARGLDSALSALEETFSRLTGQGSTRRAGETYAARTLVYEDCRRDADVRVGAQLRARLAPPLLLLLQANRWLSFHVSVAYGEELKETFRSLQGEQGGGTIDLLQLWMAASTFFPSYEGGTPPERVMAVVREYQSRWARLLSIPEGASRVERTVEELLPLARELFHAPHPGWPSARVHSPDLLIAAESVEAVCRGECLFVLGEMHANANTLEMPIPLAEHPDLERLRRALELDFPDPRFAPTTPSRDATRAHMQPLTGRPEDVCLEHEEILSWRPRAQTLRISELVVSEEQGRLRVSTRDGQRGWDILQVMDSLLAGFDMPLLPPSAHTPRVTVDSLVIRRESWRIEGAQLPFLALPTPFERYLGFRRWARALGLPRFCFYKASTETKPFFLDLDSLPRVEEFLKGVRHAEFIMLSEMLPTLEQSWLPDAEDARYTCELRMVAVDPEPWRAA